MDERLAKASPPSEKQRLAAGWLAIVVSSSSCVQALPPPPAPERSLPPISTFAGEGKSRMVITTDVPARVKVNMVSAASSPGTAQKPANFLCAKTPCAVTLPPGDYRFAFSGMVDEGRSSLAAIKVRNDVEVLNHTLGQDRENPGQYIGAAMMFAGGLALVGGGLAALAGTVTHDQGDRYDATNAHVVELVGLAGLVLGSVVLATNPNTTQAGSSTQWSPEPGKTNANALSDR